MKRIIITIITAVCAAVLLFSCGSFTPFSPSAEGEPYVSDMEPARAENIHRLLDEEVNLRELPGIQLYVRDASDGTWYRTAGTETFEHVKPVTKSDRFRIASMTKFYCAGLVLKLAEEGTLSLDDTVDTWFDGFPDADAITVRQLLNHTAGVAEPLRNFGALIQTGMAPNTRWEKTELIDMLAAGGNDFEPGSRHEYSNGNYILLGLIIEKAAGASFGELIQSQIADPLGLKSTAVHDPGDAAELISG